MIGYLASFIVVSITSLVLLLVKLFFGRRRELTAAPNLVDRAAPAVPPKNASGKDPCPTITSVASAACLLTREGPQSSQSASLGPVSCDLIDGAAVKNDATVFSSSSSSLDTVSEIQPDKAMPDVKNLPTQGTLTVEPEPDMPTATEQRTSDEPVVISDHSTIVTEEVTAKQPAITEETPLSVPVIDQATPSIGQPSVAQEQSILLPLQPDSVSEIPETTLVPKKPQEENWETIVAQQPIVCEKPITLGQPVVVDKPPVILEQPVIVEQPVESPDITLKPVQVTLESSSQQPVDIPEEHAQISKTLALQEQPKIDIVRPPEATLILPIKDETALILPTMSDSTVPNFTQDLPAIVPPFPVSSDLSEKDQLPQLPPKPVHTIEPVLPPKPKLIEEPPLPPKPKILTEGEVEEPPLPPKLIEEPPPIPAKPIQSIAAQTIVDSTPDDKPPPLPPKPATTVPPSLPPKPSHLRSYSTPQQSMAAKNWGSAVTSVGTAAKLANKSVFMPAAQRAVAPRRSGGTDKMSLLVQWCQSVTANYQDVKVTNITTSFKDGLAFCALIHSKHPELIDFGSLKKENAAENLKIAFDAAETLGVPKLLEIEDITELEVPEKLSMATYLFELQKVLAK